MARKKLIDPAEIGAKGGRKSRSYMSQDEATALGHRAAKERWDAYYAAHPEKLKAKLEREARKGKVNRGRPPKKTTT
jgi:hypothetical protein